MIELYFNDANLLPENREEAVCRGGTQQHFGWKNG